MYKRGFGIFVLVLFVISFFSFSVLADHDGANEINEEEVESDINVGDVFLDKEDINEEKISENKILDETAKEFSDAELGTNAGITPDSAFYFVDEFFDRFGSDLENREEKIAEIKAMIEAGKFEDAKKALESYKGYADNLEREADPENREEARRSAVAIRNTLKGLDKDIPEEHKKDFVDNVLKKEGEIITAVEISNKIKALCEQLADLDPVEYSRTCSAKNDAPNWQRKLDKKLTEEQKKEAEKFFGIMSQCFRDPSKCNCDDIPVKSFADKCNIISPLAVKCEQKGDEDACDLMDEATEGIEDLLPEHLQAVMEDVEREFGDAEFDNHAPRECREKGANDRKSCMKIMFELNAPEECVEALNKGEINIDNERDARMKCEEIMFRENAPEECVEAGLKDHKECGRFMFKENAPEECIEAGLTGENRNDHKKCEEIMRSKGGERGGVGHGGFGANCRDIQNSEERLKCFDGAGQGIGQKYEQRGPPGGWPDPCQKAQAFSRESCERIMNEFGSGQGGDFEKRYRETKDSERQCAQSCRDKGGAWDFSGGQCNCRIDEQREEFRGPENFGGFRPPEGFVPPEGFRPPEGFVPPQGQFPQQPSPIEGQQATQPQQTPSTESSTTTPTTESSGTSSGTTTSGSSSTSSGSSGGSGGAGITGGVISVDNKFFNYFFK